MGHNHHHGDFATQRASGKKAMVTVFSLTLAFMFLEVIAGLYTHSLALVADAGHMLGDAAALGLALIAVWFSSKPSSPDKSFGYYRSEILAAFVNGLFLIGMSVYILYEAAHRLWAPPVVLAGPMMMVAAAGLVINLIGAKLLAGSSEHSLNAKAAYFEVLSDLLGSVAVLLAGGIMMLTHWYWVDPIISGLIGLMIIPRTWSLIKECSHILMQGSPARVNLEELEAALQRTSGVSSVHDIHVWTITQGKDVLSCHIVADNQVPADALRHDISEMIEATFGINHSTIQIEHLPCSDIENSGCIA